MTLESLLATPDYAGLSDADAAALAKTPRHPVTREARHTYLSLARTPPEGIGPDATRRLIATVRAVAASDPLVDEVQYRLRDNGGGVDVGDPVTGGMLGAFAADAELQAALGADGLTAADAEAITFLGRALLSDAELHGLGRPHAGDVAAARSN